MRLKLTIFAFCLIFAGSAFGQSFDVFNGGRGHWWSPGDANEVTIRTGSSAVETYQMKWPIDSGEPNSVLMTPGDTDSQLVWGTVEPNLIIIDPNDPNVVNIGLPTKTPWNVMFADVNGYPLTDDPNDFTYYQPERAFGIGMDSVTGRTYADNLIEVYSLLLFDPNTLSTSIGWGGDNTTMTGPNNLRIAFDAGTALTIGYQNSLGGKGSGASLTESTDNAFWGYQTGLNVTNTLPVRDEALAFAGRHKIRWADEDYAITLNEDLTGSTQCSTIQIDDATGNVIAGSGPNAEGGYIYLWDIDLNREDDWFQPDDNWGSSTNAWQYCNTVRFSTDGESVYATGVNVSSYQRIYKFDLATGAEIWNYEYLGLYSDALYIDASDNCYFFKNWGGLGIVKINSSGSYVSLTGTSGIAFPRDIWIDEANDRYYLAGYGAGGDALSAVNSGGSNSDTFNTGAANTKFGCVLKEGDYIYACGEREAYGVGAANATVVKLDTELVLQASYDTGAGTSATYLAVNADGNIIVRVFGQTTQVVLDTDLALVTTFQSSPEMTDYRMNEIIVIPHAAEGLPLGSRNTAIGSQALAGASAGAEPNEASAGGYKSQFNVEGGDLSTSWGAWSLYSIETGDQDVAYGPFAGWPITTEDDYIVFDSRKRTSIADMERMSIIVGQTADDPNDQWLNINVGELNLDFGRFDVNDVNVAGDLILDGFSTGSVLFADSSGIISENNANLSWDNTNLTLDVNAVDVNNVAVLKPDSAVFQPNADAVDFFQVKNAAGTVVPLNVNTTNNQVTVGNTSSTYPFLINSTDGSDQIQLYHDNTDAWLRYNDGLFKIQTSEAGNKNTNIFVYGNGTGIGRARFYDGSDATYFSIQCQNGLGDFLMAGSAPVQLRFQNDGLVPATFYSGVVEGVTQYLILSGWRTGAAARENLRIAVGLDAEDTVSFYNLGNYYFAGNVGVNEIAPETLLELTHAQPWITTQVSTHTNDARLSKWIGKGNKLDETEHSLASISIDHDGTGDDFLGKVVIATNANGGADTLVDHVEIDSAGITSVGDLAGSNQAVIEADGTVRFDGDATVWDDYVTPLSRALFGGSSNDPTLTKIADDGAGSAGVWGFVFSDGDEVLATVQMPHSWKVGSTIYPHVHFFCMTDVTPTDNFDLEIEYWWSDIGEDFPANTTLVNTEHETGVDTQYQHQLANLTAAGIDGSGHTLSSVLMIRIERVAAAGDNYGDGICIMDFDVHFEKDTVGSRTATSK